MEESNVEANLILRLWKSQLRNLPGNISVRPRFRWQLRCADESGRRTTQTTYSGLRDQRRVAGALRRAAHRHGTQGSHRLVDSNHTEATGTIHLRPVFESRSHPDVLAVAALRGPRVVC